MLLLSSRRILPVRCWHCCSGAGGHRDAQDTPRAAGLCWGGWVGVTLTTVSPWRGGSAHGFLWGLEAMSRGCHPQCGSLCSASTQSFVTITPAPAPLAPAASPSAAPPVSQAALLQARQWQEEEKKNPVSVGFLLQFESRCSMRSS